jgi:hypothetical protein
MYECGEWPKDFTEVTMFALKKKPKARKCTDHRTVSLIAHVVKVVASVIRRRSEKKTEDAFGEDPFGFRKGTRDATGMLRIISERTLVIGEEICICFIDPAVLTLQKYSENWTEFARESCFGADTFAP